MASRHVAASETTKKVIFQQLPVINCVTFFHFPVHSDHRPYKCAFCSSAFKSSSNRSKHERGSHSQQYQKRKHDRELQRNGDADADEPAAKRVKIAPALQQQSPKVIKLEPAPSPKKQVSTDFPCRYCDRVFKRADSRDKHETTHKDFNAFGWKIDGVTWKSTNISSLFRLRVLFQELQNTRSPSSAHKNPHEALVFPSWLPRSVPGSPVAEGA